MEYEVSSRTPGLRWPILIPPILVAAIVLASFVGGAGDGADLAVAASLPAASPLVVPTAAPSSEPPDWVDCGGVPPVDCHRAVTAARAALGDGHPPVNSAALSPALRCGGNQDCPWELLARSRTVGSVVLTFAGVPSMAWVNVVEPGPGAVWAGSPRQLVALVIRWLERPA